MKNNELIKHAFKIKPLVRVLTKVVSLETINGVETQTETNVVSLEENWNKGKLAYISSKDDIAKDVFTWDPEPILNVDISNLQEIGRYTAKFTDCRFAFKPTVKEIIEQMPEDLLDNAACFEVIDPDLTPNANETSSATIVVYKSLIKNMHPAEILKQTIKCNGKTYRPILKEEVEKKEIENDFCM